MIEKFSDEELRVIEKELAEKRSRIPYTKSELHKYIRRQLEDVLSDFQGKNTKLQIGIIDFIPKIADVAFKNYRSSMSSDKLISNSHMPHGYVDEYMKMCNEIVEIIKKHNRKWEE